jgi:hypothetical protein
MGCIRSTCGKKKVSFLGREEGKGRKVRRTSMVEPGELLVHSRRPLVFARLARQPEPVRTKHIPISQLVSLLLREAPAEAAVDGGVVEGVDEGSEVFVCGVGRAVNLYERRVGNDESAGFDEGFGDDAHPCAIRGGCYGEEGVGHGRKEGFQRG